MEVAVLYEHAAAASTARELLQANDWEGLLAFLGDLKPELARDMDELKMAWQEYLTVALERAATSKDQADLKQTLRLATEHGMLATERPVWKALEVFVDPPTIIFQPPAQVGMHPEPGGAVVLRVNIRSTETIQWYKNGIALKEGADGGRVKGVTTNTLTFGKLLPRDQGVKVWAAGKNKWGSVETTPCELMYTKVDDLKVTDHPRVSAPERKEMLDSMLEASKSFKMGTLKSFKKGGSQERDRGSSGVSPGGSVTSSGSLSRGQSISFNANL